MEVTVMKQEYWDQVLWNAARNDPEYRQLLKQCRDLEPAFREVLDALPPEQQDRLQDYISLCEALERRLTELYYAIPRS